MLMKRVFLLFVVLFLGGMFAANGKEQSNDQPSPSENQSVNSPLKIKKKPSARAQGCDRQSSGVIRVKVTFDKSGVVTKVVRISGSGCGRFDDEAIRAAKKIKFEPATKDGVAVTVVRTLEYVFSFH